MADQVSAIEIIISNYIERKERSIFLTKKRTDLEKEYNRQLTLYCGEAKNYSLEQADIIYTAHQQMMICGEESKIAMSLFDEAEEKLKELGNILFESTINAEISITMANGAGPVKRKVKVAYYGGEVILS